MERTQFAALIVPSHLTPGINKPAGAVDPLAPIAGKSIAGWIADAALGASVRRIALIGDSFAAETRSELIGRADGAMVEFVRPVADVADTLAFALERLGSELTLRESTHVVVLPAECPQVESSDIRSLIDHHLVSRAAATVCLTDAVDTSAEPVILRDEQGQVTSIVDAPLSTTSLMCVRASLLTPALRRVSRGGWGSGAPLGDIAAVLTEAGHSVHTMEQSRPLHAIRSMTSRASVEVLLRDRIVEHWLSFGVAMPDTRQVAIDATVSLGQGVHILPGSVLEGATTVAEGARIGPNTQLIDASIGCSAHVPHSVVYSAEVEAHTELEPFTVLRGAD